MFEQFMTFLASLNDNVIWGIPMVVLMIGTGLFLLIVLYRGWTDPSSAGRILQWK